ncbi:MAG: segregation/condensation protein A [Alphaproteobacteria bacterium]|nr:segregation/condensation protein A [Alphaproteobacteria bacterium]MCB9930881.1 segregation/condensation protein A [Alphaproteobacteria bacterium]
METEPSSQERRTPDAEWTVDLAGYEGPIDLLLALARDRKIDLAVLSISALADQYLAFIAEAKAARLEIAAEYLVMAAWLAYLKSRLLLPRDEPSPDGQSATELAEALAEQMRRLEAMQQAAKRLFALPRRGRDWHGRGGAEGLPTRMQKEWVADLPTLLRSYGAVAARRTPPPVLSIDPGLLTSVEAALARLERLVGQVPSWGELRSFLPRGLRPGIQSRSALASSFVASLELAKAGQVRLRQDETYGPLYLSRRRDGAGPPEEPGDG